MRNMVFFWIKKLMEKMIFTDYGKVLVLNFSVVGNTVFFWVKKLTERWYLLVTQFLFWTFRWWEIRSFFQPKSWWKNDIYLVLLAFHDIPRPGIYGFSCRLRRPKLDTDLHFSLHYSLTVSRCRVVIDKTPFFLSPGICVWQCGIVTRFTQIYNVELRHSFISPLPPRCGLPFNKLK